MFGNTVIYSDEMLGKDQKRYSAYYCGLCHKIGKSYARSCRLALSYEMTFLAVFMSALKDGEGETHALVHCPGNPFKKKNVIQNSRAIDIAASLSVIMSYESLRDKARDEGFIKKLGAFIGKALFRRSFKKACRALPVAYKTVKDCLEELYELEEGYCHIPEAVSDPFARLVAEVVSQFTTDETTPPHEKEAIWRFSYYTGQLIYVLDAFKDIDEDLKKGEYNPFIAAALSQGGKIPEEPQLIKEQFRDDADFILSSAMAVMSNALDALNTGRNKPILENIIFVGMPARAKSILEGTFKKKHSRSE